MTFFMTFYKSDMFFMTRVNPVTPACFAGDNINDRYNAFENIRNNIGKKFHLIN